MSETAARGVGRYLKGLRWLIAGAPHERRRARLELARILVGFLGDFALGDDYKIWREDAEFLADYARLCPTSPYSQERKWVLREYARSVRALPGAVAECGCYEGASAYFIARALPDTPIHLFDSFEGLSRPGEADATHAADHRDWKPGDMKAAEAKVRENLAGFDNVHIHRGWIPQSFAAVERERFRLVHIDVDLYQPTRDSLEFFYPRLVDGGVLVLDDYGSALCPGAKRAVDEFLADKPECVVHLSTMQGVMIRRTPAGRTCDADSAGGRGEGGRGGSG